MRIHLSMKLKIFFLLFFFSILLFLMLYQLNIKANTFIEPVIQVKKNVVIRKPTIKNKVLQEAVTEEIENSKNNLFKTYKDASFYVDGSVYETENYESVFLIIETYVGGAHPCNDI